MAMFHCSIKIISRASGRSAVASAAYRSGEKLYNDETGITHDFTRKGGVAERCELNREIRKYNVTLEKIKEIALDITRTVVGKARKIINGFNELRGSRADIGNTRADVDNFGRTADRNRTVGADTATLIREIRTATDNARVTVDASRTARENRDLEQQRLAVERSGSKIETKQGEPDRSRKDKKTYDRGR